RENFPLCIKRLPSSTRCAIPNSRRTASRISGGTEPPPFSLAVSIRVVEDAWGFTLKSAGMGVFRTCGGRLAASLEQFSLFSPGRNQRRFIEDAELGFATMVLVLLSYGVGTFGAILSI